VQRFFRHFSSILISLILATLVWIAAINEQNPPREDEYAQSIPVEIIPPKAGLVTTDKLPESVRLQLRAPESSWLDLVPSKFKATLDLSQLSAGFSEVPIRVVASDPEIEIIRVRPQGIGVTLQVERTISLPVTVKIMDDPPLGYVSRTPVVEPQTVTITGPDSAISRAYKAVSEVFIRGSKETIEGAREVVIRDRNDQTINNLQIDPPSIQLTLPIEQRFGYKEVSVSPVIVGRVAPGYRLSSVSVDPPTLTIVGNPKVLSSVAGFIETAQIDLSQATESFVRTVPLILPDGITIVMPERRTEGPGGVEVTVQITPIEDGIVLQRPVTQQGIDPNYTWTASPERAEVFLSGPIPLLQTLKASNVEVIVDLFGLEPGVYKVEPRVFMPDGLRVDTVLPDIIEVTISLAPTPTPSPTPSPAPTLDLSRFFVNTPTATVEQQATPQAKSN
jgi:YbbR domain-containing protein